MTPPKKTPGKQNLSSRSKKKLASAASVWPATVALINDFNAFEDLIDWPTASDFIKSRSPLVKVVADPGLSSRVRSSVVGLKAQLVQLNSESGFSENEKYAACIALLRQSALVARLEKSNPATFSRAIARFESLRTGRSTKRRYHRPGAEFFLFRVISTVGRFLIIKEWARQYGTWDPYPEIAQLHEARSAAQRVLVALTEGPASVGTVIKSTADLASAAQAFIGELDVKIPTYRKASVGSASKNGGAWADISIARNIARNLRICFGNKVDPTLCRSLAELAGYSPTTQASTFLKQISTADDVKKRKISIN